MTSPSAVRDSVLGDPLAEHSIRVIREGQSVSGAFVACQAFPVYGFSWLRDGSFCAFAMDLVGERGSAAAFHGWVARSLEANRSIAEVAVRRIEDGDTPPAEAMLPARYTLDGRLEPGAAETWPNFQLDGYGTWLWALERHVAGGAVPRHLAVAAELVARYLTAAWRLPCYGWWEELDDGEHASTLGAVAAGLTAAARLLEAPAYADEGEAVRAHLFQRFVRHGRLARGANDDRLDGSLVSIWLPFELLPIEDGRVAATARGIEEELATPSGGVRRYLGDTYYGGGEWILLTCWLGWHAAVNGDRELYERTCAWVRAQARSNGDLPEQVTDRPQAVTMVQPWVERWGPVATPLLWSHAMYLVMEAAAARARWSSSH